MAIAVGASHFAEAVVHSSLEAAEVGRHVGHGVAHALVGRLGRGVGASAFGHGAVSDAIAVAPQVGLTNTDGAEHVVTGGGAVGSGQLAAQTHFTEAAFQAHGGLALEGEAVGGSANVVAGVAVAVIQVQAGFEHEVGLQATAQVFHAAEADAAGQVVAGGHAGPVLVTVDVGHASVGHAVQGHGRLGHGGARSGQHSQGEQGFFHCKYSKV